MPLRMRERSRTRKNYFPGLFFTALHRAFAALRAWSLSTCLDSFAALALPPFNPPSFPSATAAGFLAAVLERLGIPTLCRIPSNDARAKLRRTTPSD